MKVQEAYYYRILLSFVIATILFVLIFFSAYSVSYLNYKSIRTENNIIQDSLLRLDEILASESCLGVLLLESSIRLDEVGSRLGILEKRFGADDERVLEQKKFYSDLEFKHLQIIKNFNEKCATDFKIVFFFYSNSGSLLEESERMGAILGAFKRENSDLVMIYSFDVNLDYGLIDKLEEIYGIDRAPIAVLNEKDLVYVRNIDDLEKDVVGRL